MSKIKGRDQDVRVRLTRDEKRAVKQLAQMNGLNVSDWLRYTLRQEARRAGVEVVEKGET